MQVAHVDGVAGQRDVHRLLAKGVLELAGPEAGQWVLVIRFSDLASFGTAMAAVLADTDARAILEDLEKISPMTSRRIVAEVDV